MKNLSVSKNWKIQKQGLNIPSDASSSKLIFSKDFVYSLILCFVYDLISYYEICTD